MIARDIMTKHTVAVESGSSIFDLIGQMFEHDIRHVPVVKDGRLVGIVSERDVRELLYPLTWNAARADEHSELLQRPVAYLMNKEVISVDTEATVTHIIDLMLKERIGSVPVVDPHEQSFVGIVSYVDVLKALRFAA